MNVRVVRESLANVKADAVVVNLFEGVTTPARATGAVDSAMGGAISHLVAAGDFRGTLNETVVIYAMEKIPARKVILVGLGDPGRFDAERARQAAAAAARKAKETGAEVLASVAHGAGAGGLEPGQAARATVEGTILGLYSLERYKSKPDPGSPEATKKKPEVKEFLIAEIDEAKAVEEEKGARAGEIMAEAANFARDLANAPSNYLTPSAFAAEAEKLAHEVGLDCEILGREEMQRAGMGAFLGVAKGSDEPPRLVVLRYRGGRADEAPLALIGKGLTFDSGGISLKPSEGMEAMMMDMSGAAAVLAAMRAIGTLKPPANVIGLMALTENMPSGHAQKPGDVVTAMNGKTIEVVNTDAEGRLVLLDTICYAKELGVSRIVDVATLTGACVVALGHVATGLVGNDAALIETVKQAAAAAGEKVWQLPAYEEYKHQYKSDVADLKNTGGRAGGTITGAMIIGEFAGKTPWVHLDIAGTAWDVSEIPYQPNKGASGVMARTLIELAQIGG